MIINFKETFLFITITLLTAFIANYLSPVGIAVFGDWDSKNGVISAKAKNSVVSHKREITSINVVKELFDKGVVFIDARSLEKFRDGHIKGALSVPVNKFDDKMEMIWTRFSKDTEIVTYCSGYNCQDSHHLAQNLEQIGFSNVKVFPGGFPEWKKEGFPVE